MTFLDCCTRINFGLPRPEGGSCLVSGPGRHPFQFLIFLIFLNFSLVISIKMKMSTLKLLIFLNLLARKLILSAKPSIFHCKYKQYPFPCTKNLHFPNVFFEIINVAISKTYIFIMNFWNYQCLYLKNLHFPNEFLKLWMLLTHNHTFS